MPVIYDFSDLQSYMRAYMKARKQKQSAFSYRWLAKRLGLKSHAHVGAIVRGEKVATAKLMDQFFALMNLESGELLYAKALLGLQNAKTPEERQFFSKKIESLRGKEGQAKILPGGATKFIEKWYHAAILEMIGMSNWREDTKLIARRLRAEVTPSQVEASIKLLLKLGLVKRDDAGKLQRVAESFISTNNVPNAAIRMFHKQMLEKSIRAVDDFKVTERTLLGHTLPIDKSRLKEAQQLIFEFQKSLHNLMQTVDGDEIYHLSIQMFPLTQFEESPQ